ncbi:glycosyltransferase family 8 protein [Pseudophaeobacter sp. TrK17]|uniref:glycosyltransferase family 8 protein n=1 Tax=Pseudophaeobacter sp. TrK17 TaxID=2815167 RepID=UPI0035CF5BCD
MKKAMVYICGEDFFAPSLVSCLSFSTNYYDDVDRFIFLCTENDEFIEQARQYCADQKTNVQILKMSITAASNFPLMAHLHPAAYGRLFLHDYLDPSYSRVMYIDGDTLSGSVDVDFEQDLSGKVFGAVQDIGVVASGSAAQLLHQSPSQGAKYFNAGVLLIDWPLWCEQEIGPLCNEYLNSNLDAPYGDQCALNNICVDKWAELHPSWNTQTDFLADPQLVQAAKVIHFTGAAKPWQRDLWKHNVEYSEYYEKTLSGHPFDSIFRPATAKSSVKRAFRSLEKKLRLRKMKNWAAWVAEHYG